LHRLSGGDPLLVSLYVRDLWQRGGPSDLRAEDLMNVKPGLAGYFDRWWKDQLLLWGRHAPLHEAKVRLLLSILCCAFGPLCRDELLALARSEGELSSWTLDGYLEPIRRFVVKNGDEYVFTHPLFAQHLWNDVLDAKERAHWDGRFLEWGRS